jgi:hypothetical protein
MPITETFLSLAEKYQNQECPGVAAFLRFMNELEDEKDHVRVFELILAKRLETQTFVKHPLVFFTLLHKIRLRNPPFIDQGLKIIDTVCGEAAVMWEATDHKKH